MYKFFKTKGFFSPDREKGEELVPIKKIEWKQHLDTNRSYAILNVQELLPQGNAFVPVKGLKAHYVWQFDNQEVEDYPLEQIWAEEEYVKEQVVMEAV